MGKPLLSYIIHSVIFMLLIIVVIMPNMGFAQGIIDFSTLSGSEGFKFSANEEGSLAGNSISSGDLNGDGFDDLIVGARGAPVNGSDAGQVFVIFGNSSSEYSLNLGPSFLDGTTGYIINGINSSDQTGRAVAAGDINNDGKDDLIIGASGADVGGIIAAGKVYIIFGGQLASLDADDGNTDGSINLANLDALTEGFMLNGYGTSDQVGYSIATGDLNNNDHHDLIIGAFAANERGDTANGATYVIYGNQLSSADDNADGIIDLSTLDGTDGYILSGIRDFDESGYSVASADVNGDSFSDIIVGAHRASTNGTNAGETYIVFGNSLSTLDAADGSVDGNTDFFYLDGTTGYKIFGEDNSGRSGYTVSAGDVDGDGRNDVLIGAFAATVNGNTFTGKSYLLFGNRLSEADANDGNSDGGIQLAGLNGTNGFTIPGINGNDQSGNAVSSGNFNGDGFQDILIGAQNASPNGRTYAGESYVIYGSQSVGSSGSISLTSLDGSNGFRFQGALNGDAIGISVSSGDLNGDNIDEVLVGSPKIDIEIDGSPDVNNVGAVYAYYSNNNQSVSNENNSSEIPTTAQLDQNYPNPFNPATTIKYELPKAANVQLEVYNMLGQHVTQLVDKQQSAGTYEATFDAGKFNSGVYIYKLTVAGKVITKKMTLIK